MSVDEIRELQRRLDGPDHDTKAKRRKERASELPSRLPGLRDADQVKQPQPANEPEGEGFWEFAPPAPADQVGPDYWESVSDSVIREDTKRTSS